MLKEIDIIGLFNKFDYEIKLKNDGITILTGPNGYGKTTILKIIHAVFRKNIFYFFKLPFKKISLNFTDNKFTIYKNGDTLSIDGKELTKDRLLEVFKRALRDTEYRHLEGNQWRSRYKNEIFTTDDLFDKLSPKLLNLGEDKFDLKFPFLDNQLIYLIREQRLLKQNDDIQQGHFQLSQNANIFIETIKEYAIDLRNKISKQVAKNANKMQELDSNFPIRIIEEQNSITEENFEERFQQIKAKYEKLSQYGLAPHGLYMDHSYSKENAKVLLVYIQDTENKLAVFDDFLVKLDLFVNILNVRRFQFKSIKVTKEKGFCFLTTDDKNLSPTDLSSGEQHEVIMLYELLFKVSPGTLVLIDEPEISLHVVWQKAFVDDLKEIAKIQQINAILATHSPQIVNNEWDLVVDLEDICKCKNI